MDQIIIENVRCFRRRHVVPLAPLTFLVGENSTGKSTFLAMARLACDVAVLDKGLDFNEEPYLLGAYDQIATQLGNRSAKSFAIGGRFSGQSKIFVARFVSRAGQPVLRHWSYGAPSTEEIAIEYDKGGKPLSMSLGSEPNKLELDIKKHYGSLELPLTPWLLPFFGSPMSPKSGSPRQYSTELIQLSKTARSARPYAFAPIRTKPKRSYDPLQEILDPEGSHVPMLLYRLSRDPAAWDRLSKPLEDFGSASGLFSNVEVRTFAEGNGGPFQIRVSIDGISTNFIDVGYGISQILPIVVDCIRGPEGSAFLLQQPEVHLHPKAQAELNSFLALLAKQQKKQFLIETHSDYLVDRIRMDVRDRKHGLRPEDVVILYFERQGGEAHIHPMTLDSYGNLLDAPPTYRRFFLEEERRFLGG